MFLSDTRLSKSVMMLVKLGGSVITNKTGLRDFQADRTKRLALEISRSGERVILVHGAGSFGHVLAHRYSLQKGFESDEQINGMGTVMSDVRDLNLRVMREFESVGVPCASIPPSAVGELDNGRLVEFPTEKFESFLELRIMPVTFGDVCLDRSKGFGICSGDQLMEWLSMTFRPQRTIFCADVDGVYTCDPNVDPDARLLAEIDENTLSELPRTERCLDVTGSIYGKIESMLTIASHSGECLVINGMVPGRLESALRGEEVLGSSVISGG
jgi:isopentenyl phosphate kinase